MSKLSFYTSILAIFTVFSSLSQAAEMAAEATSGKIDTKSRETIKIEAERSITVSLGRAQLSGLTNPDGKGQNFENENYFGVGFQQFINSRYSVNASMNFAFNSRGEQDYYNGAVQMTYHRPLSGDKLNFRASVGMSFSQYQFSNANRVNRNQVSWLEGIASTGIEYKLRKDISILSMAEVRQSGISSIDNQNVEGTSFAIQPIGLMFYY